MKEKKLKRSENGKRNIFKFIFLILRNIFSFKSIYTLKGTHLFSGYPGSGKTLLVNKIIQGIDKNKYFVLSNIKEFDDVQTFDLTELFHEGRQVKKLPKKDKNGRKLYALIIDEVNLTFNRRMNRTSKYNDLFVGLVEMLVSHRHQGIPRIFFIGQKLELQDTQLQSLFKFQHDIITNKTKYKYYFYKKTGNVFKVPIKLYVVNRVKTPDDVFIEHSFDKIKIKNKDLESYDTYALKSNYDNLSLIKLKE